MSRTASEIPVTVHPVPAMGAEDVLIADKGLIYTGTEDGSVFAVRPDGSRVERVGHTGGRPVVETLQRSPVPLRRIATSVPEALQPKPKRTVRVAAFDDAGACVHDVQADPSGFHAVTGVR